jgi:hypothetical protein
LTSFEPMRPVPPMTTIFIFNPPANVVFDAEEDAGSRGGKPCGDLQV